MSEFVKPEIVRLTLRGGQTVDIKKRLDHGETEDLFARISPYGVGVNRREVRTAKILSYLVGWSFLGLDEQPVAYTPTMLEQARIDLIRSLDPEIAVEVHQAIEAHEAAEDKRRADRKNTTGGTPVSAAISPSPSDADGRSETSAPSA